MATVSYIQPTEVEDQYEDGWPGAGRPGYGARRQALDLRQVLRTLWRRKIILIGTAVVLTALAFLWVMQATPLYVAEAQIVVEQQRERTLDFQEVLQSGPFDYTTTMTEASVIMSRRMAEKVVDELGLVDHPVFNPDAEVESRSLFEELDIRSSLKGFVRDLVPEWLREELRHVRRAEAEAATVELSEEEEAQQFRNWVVDAFHAGSDVLSNQRSRVLRIQYVSDDPEFAALAANALAEAYINETVLRKFEANARATDWLNQQVAELRQRLEGSQAALQEHRRRVGLLDLEGQTNLLKEQLAQLNIDLVRARAARAEAEARHRQVQKLLSSDAGVESAGAVLDSQLIQRLREQEAAVIRELAELKTQLRDQHPRLVLKQSELADLRTKIEREVGKLAGNLGNELELARIREQGTSDEVERLRREIEQQNEDLLELRHLESEVEANEKIYDAILTRFKQTDVQDDVLLQADARMISPAIAPDTPSFPRKTLILAAAFFASLGLGVVLVFVAEHLEVGFRTMEQVESLTGLPGLGIVPELRRRALRDRAPHDLIVDEPNSAYTEAIRSIRTTVQIAAATPPKVLLVTSSLPNEGKSTLTAALARSAARGGQRVVALDTDIRSPSLHRAFNTANLQGLSEYLVGEVEPEEVIDVDATSGVHFITAGHYAPRISDLLGDKRMAELVEQLQEAYDLVVVDAAPVLAVADALVLQRLVDRSIYVVRWSATPRESVEVGIRALYDAGAKLAGVVLNQADMKRYATYAYGGNEYTKGLRNKYYYSS